MLAGKKLVIFDVYGTLLSTGTGSVEAVRSILAFSPQSPELPGAESFYAVWKRLHRKSVDRCISSGAFVTEAQMYRAELCELYALYGIERDGNADAEIMLRSRFGRKPYPDAPDAVAKLRERFRVVIGSTTDDEPLFGNLNNCDLVVDAVYTSENMQLYKPSRAFYEHILRSEGVTAAETVFVGDSLRDDVAGPQNAGLAAVWIDRKGDALPEDIRPDAVISSLSELRDVLM